MFGTVLSSWSYGVCPIAVVELVHRVPGIYYSEACLRIEFPLSPGLATPTVATVNIHTTDSRNGEEINILARFNLLSLFCSCKAVPRRGQPVRALSARYETARNVSLKLQHATQVSIFNGTTNLSVKVVNGVVFCPINLKRIVN